MYISALGLHADMFWIRDHPFKTSACSRGGGAEIYIQSAPNNSNETYTLMCLGRTGRFGQH